MARHTEAEAAKNSDLRDEVSTAEVAARHAKVEVADYNRWADTLFAQLGTSQRELAGAVARIGKLDERIAAMTRALEGAKSRVEIAESATARALGSRAQQERDAPQLLISALRRLAS